MSNKTEIKKAFEKPFLMAGETRIEHATYGFGDRCSAN